MALRPVTAPTADAAMQELRAIRGKVKTIRTLMRIRATSGEKRQSFNAQMSIAGNRMELTAYSPIGTTVMTLIAEGDQVSFRNSAENTEWQGSAEQFARSYGFLGASLRPAELALLMVGLPSRDDVSYEATPTGLARASIGDVVVTYDPPAFPPTNVTVRYGTDTLEITHNELVAE